MLSLNTALTGMLAAAQRFDQSATRLVQDAPSGEDIASDILDQIEARTAFAANASVARTANEMTGRLLDILA